MDEYINNYIDKCISKSDYDISVVIFEMIKHKFKYMGKNKWYYLKLDDWKEDKRTYNLKIYIQTTVCNAFIQRAFHWEKKKNFCENDYVSKNLLDICNKLKNYNFVTSIIRECRQFYNFE